MTVGFLSGEKKETNGEEGKKHLADFIPAPTPKRKKKVFGTACCLGIVAALCLVAFAIGLTLVFVLTQEDEPRRANIQCDGDCNDKYDCGYHGRRTCGDYDGDYSLAQFVGGDFPQYSQWMEKVDNVYYVEVSSSCSANSDKTFITMDMNTGYTAIKTAMRDGHGLRCMLFDNAALLKHKLDDVYSYDGFEVTPPQFDLHVETILTGFYKYGEPVPQQRDYLGSHINDVCGSDVPFYYMIDGEDSFRSQVADIMAAYDVAYDDIFDFFVDIYVALTDKDAQKLDETLGQWDEIIGVMPDGYYDGHTSSTGVGWSLNIESTTWYPCVKTEANFYWSGTLVPPEDDQLPAGAHRRGGRAD